MAGHEVLITTRLYDHDRADFNFGGVKKVEI
jgi:hypothetical protein